MNRVVTFLVAVAVAAGVTAGGWAALNGGLLAVPEVLGLVSAVCLATVSVIEAVTGRRRWAVTLGRADREGVRS